MIGKNNKAFTLIELLVVVAIIGILAAVGVVAYNGYTSAAKVNIAKANHNAVLRYIKNEITRCEIDSTAKIFENILDCKDRHSQQFASSIKNHGWRALINRGFTNPYPERKDFFIKYGGRPDNDTYVGYVFLNTDNSNHYVVTMETCYKTPCDNSTKNKINSTINLN